MPKDARGNVWMLGSCPSCGLIGAGPLEDIEAQIKTHYGIHHPEHSHELVHGVDYEVWVAPMRCDTCTKNVELPYWSHHSDPPTHQPMMRDVDGRWLLCDTCHGFLAAKDINGWLRHTWATTLEAAPWLESAPDRDAKRVALGRHLRNLIANLDEGQRNSLSEPGPFIP